MAPEPPLLAKHCDAYIRTYASTSPPPPQRNHSSSTTSPPPPLLPQMRPSLRQRPQRRRRRPHKLLHLLRQGARKVRPRLTIPISQRHLLRQRRGAVHVERGAPRQHLRVHVVARLAGQVRGEEENAPPHPRRRARPRVHRRPPQRDALAGCRRRGAAGCSAASRSARGRNRLAAVGRISSSITPRVRSVACTASSTGVRLAAASPHASVAHLVADSCVLCLFSSPELLFLPSAWRLHFVRDACLLLAEGMHRRSRSPAPTTVMDSRACLDAFSVSLPLPHFPRAGPAPAAASFGAIVTLQVCIHRHLLIPPPWHGPSLPQEAEAARAPPPPQQR